MRTYAASKVHQQIRSTGLALILVLTSYPCWAVNVNGIDIEAVPLGANPTSDGRDAISLSPDLQHVAWIGSAGSRYAAYFDGKPGEGFDEIRKCPSTGKEPPLFLFSADGNHIAYVGRHGDDYFVVADAKKWPVKDPAGLTETCFNADGSKFAFASNLPGAAHDGWAVLDGQEQPHGSGVKNIGFSGDGQHFMYALDLSNYAASGNPLQQVFVRDSQRGPVFNEIADVIYSPHGDHYAYIGVEWLPMVVGQPIGKRFHLVVDGKETAQCDAVFKLVYSPDGEHLVYDIGRNPSGQPKTFFTGERQYDRVIGVDGREYSNNGLGQTQEIQMTPDAKHLAFIEMRAQGPNVNSMRAVIDGKKGDEYAQVFNLRLSPNGEHSAFVGQQPIAGSDAVRTFVVSDGVESEAYSSSPNSWNGKTKPFMPFFSSTGRLAYFAEDSTSIFAVEDGKKGASYHFFLTDPSFSPDGSRLVYIAADSIMPGLSNEHLVVDGQSSPLPQAPQDAGSNVLIFSPDSRHVAYRGTAQMVVDGKPIILPGDPATHWPAGRPLFSSDSQHIAQMVSRQFGVLAMPRLAIDNQLISDYILASKPTAQTDGTFSCFGYGPDHAFSRITIKPGSPHNFGAGEAPPAAIDHPISSTATGTEGTVGAGTDSEARNPAQGTELERTTGKTTHSVELDDRIERDLTAPSNGIISLIGGHDARREIRLILSEPHPFTSRDIARLRQLCANIEKQQQADHTIRGL